MRNVTIKLAKLGNRALEFDGARVPEVSEVFLLTYGVQQWIADGVAGIARKNYRTDAEYLSAVEDGYRARIERVYTGDMPGTRTPASPAKALAASAGVTEAELMAAIELIKANRPVAEAA
jgi:hypothetical protein